MTTLARGRVFDVPGAVKDGAIDMEPCEQLRLDLATYSWHLVENAVLEGKGATPQVYLIRVDGATYMHWGRIFGEDGFRAVRACPRAEWSGKDPHLYRPGNGMAGVLVACGSEEFVLGNAVTESLLVRRLA